MAVVRDCASLLIGLLVFFHTWGAWAAVDIEMEDKVNVVKGGTAQITGVLTTDEGVGSMIIQWLYVKKSGEKQRIYYQDSTSKLIDRGTPFTDRISVNGTGAPGDLVLTITDVQLSDETQFICIVRTIDMTAEGRTSLYVYDTPAYPTIDVVQTGISVTDDDLSKIGTCEVKNGYPKPNITWYRNDTPLRNNNEVKIVASTTTESSGLVSVKSELSMKVMKEDKDAKFYCESSYQVPEGIKFSETKRFNITVIYPSTAVSVWVESPKGKIKEGDSVELHCQGDGNMASIITISHKDKSWETPVLMLDNVKRLDSGDYQCTYMETETFSEIYGKTNLFVHYLDEAVVSPSDLELEKGAKLEATCNALSSLQTHVVWFKNGEEVSKGNTLMLKDTMFESSGTYVCVVTVPEIEGMKTNGTLLVKINGQPEISNPKHTEMEESSGNMVELTCSIKGFPTPTVDWSTSKGKVLMGAHEEETEQGMVSRLSVQVDSDTLIFCNASNTYGTDGVAFNIKTIMHTTSPATTTTITTSSTATPTIISSSTVKANTETPQKKIKKEGSGVIIAVIIICILLLAILGSVLYFLYKKGKICGRSGKQDLTKEKSNKDSIVVEMKSDNTEEAVLLGVNGEKQPPSDQ